MTTTVFINRDKAVGMLVAGAAGDALGWPQENRSNIVGGAGARDVTPQPVFREWTRNAGSQYVRYLDPVRPGEYSDDTQLTMAVARSCLRDDWYTWFTTVELPIWPSYQRGGGGAVLNASRAWGDGHPPWVPANDSGRSKVTRYFDAGANGVAMRIAPHALTTAAEGTDEDLVRRVIRDGVTTHGHPRALVGACIHALAIRHALRHEGTLGYGELFDAINEYSAWRNPNTFVDTVGEEWLGRFDQFNTAEIRDPFQMWEATCAEVDDLTRMATDGLRRGATTNDEETLRNLGVFDKKQNGSGTVCAVAALYVASRTAPRPMGGLLRTGFLRDADTDTLCSMTGNLLGALQGTGWLGALFSDVQDREYLVDLGLNLADAANTQRSMHKAQVVEPPVVPTTAANRRWVKAIFDGRPVHMAPDGRHARIETVYELETKTQNVIGRAVMRTIDGQTLIVDKISKKAPPVLAPAAPDQAEPGTRAEPSNDHGEPTAPALPAVAGPRSPAPQILAVEVAVPDLVKSTRFFEEVLGLTCDRTSKHRVTVGPFLVLSSAKGVDQGPASSATVLSVLVDDLDAVEARAERFGSLRFQRAPQGDILWIKEPGGNVIRAVPGETTNTEANAGTRPPLVTAPAPQPSETDPETPPTSTPAEVAYMQDALFETGL